MKDGFQVQGFKPALVRRDVDMELFSLPINLVFHQHIMSDQVWARGSKVTMKKGCSTY
jgi:hypothetical protein